MNLIKKYKLKFISNKEKFEKAPNLIIKSKMLDNDNEKLIFIYKVLNILKGSHNFIMEVNSTFIINRKNSEWEIEKEFLNLIRAKGLEYKYQEIEVPNQSPLAMLSKTKSKPGHKILTYIDKSMFDSDDFKSNIPIPGSMYYIIKDHSNIEPFKLLNDFEKMTYDEKLDYFYMVAFISGNTGSIGIRTRNLDKKALNDLFVVL